MRGKIGVSSQHCPATVMQNGDEASSSIILADRALLVKLYRMVYFVQILYTYVYIFADRALLVKMLISLGTHSILCSNFVFYCISTMSNRWYAKR